LNVFRFLRERSTMASTRSCSLPLATVLVLNANRSVIEPLLSTIEGWRSLLAEDQWAAYEQMASSAALRVDRQVRLNGSAAVYRGAPDVAEAIDAALRAAGLTTSVNLTMVEPAASEPAAPQQPASFPGSRSSS
jgi:hypothetical protein